MFVQSGLTTLLTGLHDRTGPGDQQYWADGVFVAPQPGCAACHIGPATAMAGLTRYAPSTTPRWMRDAAIATFDRALQDQDTDGTYLDPTLGSAPIATMFFTNELGTALLDLRGDLPATTAARWTTALRRAADRLIDHGELTYYANGNIQVGYAETMYLTWLATGDPTYLVWFETAWNFAISPPQTGSRAGRGLIITQAPTSPDGSDGRGYLTEQSGSRLGYDPSYTEIQADVVSRIYLLGGDPRVLRVLNLLTNQLRRDVDSTGMLDTSAGTRVNLGLMPFTTPALAVLVSTGARPDLTAAARAQMPRFVDEWRATSLDASPVQFRNVATRFAVLAQTLATGERPAPAEPVPTP